MKISRTAWTGVGCLALVLAVLTLFPACKGKSAADSEKLEKITPPVEITLGTLRSVLGVAQDDSSGVVDFSAGLDKGEYVFNYRYYDSDLQNIDQDMVTEISPKIQALFKKFPMINRAVFQILVNTENPGEWKPYVSFAITRAIVDKTQWSGLLTEDFLQNVLELKRFR